MYDIEKFLEYEEWRRYLEICTPEGVTIFHYMSDLFGLFKTEYYIVKYFGKPVIGFPFANKDGLFLRFLDSSVHTLPFLGIVLFDKKFLLKRNAESEKCINLLNQNILNNSRLNIIRAVNPPYLVDVRSFLWNGWKAEVSYTYTTDPKTACISSHTMKSIRRGLKFNPRIEYNNLDLNSLMSLYEDFSRQKGFYTQELRNVIKAVLSYGIKHNLLVVTNVFDEKDYSLEIFFIDPINKVAYRLYALSSDGALGKMYDYLAIWNGILSIKSKDVSKIYLLAAPSYNFSIFASKFADNIEPHFWLIFTRPRIPLFVLRKIGIQTYPWL